jgi:hypothetical protein
MKKWILVTMFAGCARQPMQITGGRDIHAEMLAMGPGEGVPKEVSAFRAEVRRLADDRDPRHDKTVKVLRLMADAVRTLPAGEVHARAIEMDADDLLHSPAGAVHADLTKRALGEAAVALGDASRVKHIPGWPDRINIANNSVLVIDAHTPYLKQRDVIDRAFVELADAFLVGTSASTQAVGEEKWLHVHRWAGDLRGESPNIEAACGGPATTVLVERTGADVTAAVFTFGWYTPLHVRVICPKAFHTARR